MSVITASSKWRTCVAVLASYLLYSVAGLNQVHGNLSVYCLSYIKAYVDGNTTLQAPWTVALYLLGNGIGIVSVIPAVDYMSKKVICIIGSSIFITGLATSYFAIQKSVFTLDITLGLICGIGGGVLAAISLQLLIPWIKGKSGLGSSIVISSVGLFAMLINQFVTLYINPNDERPVISTTAGFTYFNQLKILDRVPYVFLYLSLISSCLLFVGCLLIQEKSNYFEDTETVISMSEEKQNASLQHSDSKEYLHQISVDLNRCIDDSNSMLKNENENLKDGTTFSWKHSIDSGIKEDSNSAETYQNVDCSNYDVPKRMTLQMNLKSKLFYVLLIMVIISMIQTSVMLNYFKIFAQLWIDEDYFLTYFVTVLSITVIISRVVWGKVYDRLGFQCSVVIYFTVLSLSYAWVYFTPAIDKWIYVVIGFVLWNTVNSHSLLLATISLKVYGPENFAMAFGLFSMSCVSVTVFTPAVFQLVLDSYGYFHIFAALSVLVIVALVVASVLPTYGN